MDYLRLGWNEVETACKSVADEIKTRILNRHVLVGISRGGLVPLRLISDYLLDMHVGTMGVRFYLSPGETAKKPELLFPVQSEIEGKNIILVDDISDSGESLIFAKEHLEKSGALEIVSLALYTKPKTKLTPDIYYKKTSEWVIFPWEVQETIKKIILNSCDELTAVDELKTAGFTEDEIQKSTKERFEEG